MSELPSSVDVLIVGSGPAGSTFAREIHRALPAASILMVEAGPRLTAETGANIRNLAAAERSDAQRAAERAAGSGDRPSSGTGVAEGRLAARPGTVLVHPADDAVEDDQKNMPAAAVASNIGGMGAHWTCACPKPGDSERIDFLGSDFDEAFARAYELLDVTTSGFPETPRSKRLLATLSRMFDEGRPADRTVQPMPLACRPDIGQLPRWSGTEPILGPLARSDSGLPFILADETLCRRLVHTEGAVTGAELVHLPTGTVTTISPRAVIVAADALRTPQLLWASGIRPPALGRYLNDQPQLHSALALSDEIVGDAPEPQDISDGVVNDPRDQLVGVTWVPFRDPHLPYHTQVMELGAAPIDAQGQAVSPRGVVGYGRFLAKDVRAEDRVEFSSELDPVGMPAITIHYGLTERDRSNIDRALRLLREEGEQLGTFLPGEEPRLLPAGSSMHYQGTVRMGTSDDGVSVCDPSSRVWKTSNLYVGGNGVIPTATACNPTATSVALAVLSARRVIAQLRNGVG